MLRDENTSLQDRITLNEEQIDMNDAYSAALFSQCDDLSTQLEGKMEVIHSLEKQLQKQEREYSSLKVNLSFPRHPAETRQRADRILIFTSNTIG